MLNGKVQSEGEPQVRRPAREKKDFLVHISPCCGVYRGTDFFIARPTGIISVEERKNEDPA